MSRLLTVSEQGSLDRALIRRTGGRIRVGATSMSVADATALWTMTTGLFPEVPTTRRADVSRARHVYTTTPRHAVTAYRARRVIGAGSLLAATASLSACATLGGNVKGDFACRAPDGICAPTSTIDDAALALIAGDGAGALPAGPYTTSPDSSPHTTLASAMPVRSGEKVLRIVFPAHIDEAGRFREAAAVHAVVERGAWMTANNAVVVPTRAPAVDTGVSDAPVETSRVMQRSLGELAASAPEVSFPNPIADIDAEVAITASDEAAKTVVERTALATPVRVPRAQGAASRGGTQTRSTATRAPGRSGISYSLPPKGQATATNATANNPTAKNPMDAIRVQVANQLATSRPMGPAAVVPIAPGPSSIAGVAKLPVKPVNAPSLFPVSDIER